MTNILFFNEELIEGIIISEKSKFIMTVKINAFFFDIYYPDNSKFPIKNWYNIPCLIREIYNNKGNKYKEIFAISIDKPNIKNKKWIGINGNFSNKLFEFFLENHIFDDIFSQNFPIKKNFKVNNRFIDFKINSDILVEIKTPFYYFVNNRKIFDMIKRKEYINCPDNLNNQIKEMINFNRRKKNRNYIFLIYQFNYTTFIGLDIYKDDEYFYNLLMYSKRMKFNIYEIICEISKYTIRIIKINNL